MTEERDAFTPFGRRNRRTFIVLHTTVEPHDEVDKRVYVEQAAARNLLHVRQIVLTHGRAELNQRTRLHAHLSRHVDYVIAVTVCDQP